ncbi:hypothetical protein [uncultured Thiohalocapsa sp.]|uniref:hypothetical protein n=1 Tax=uncultured Thiohalocapsa sp. TaxID=768990 RepID=UPI0025CDE4F0|nr:hypothetical protein [uncultured Thiohalocapsa sp.]
MKTLVTGLAATLFSLAAIASGPGGDPGATGSFSDYLSASENSDDRTSYIHVYRHEYADGYAYGWVSGNVEGFYFDCALDYDEDLLEIDGKAESAVIAIDADDVAYCWFSSLPASIVFECEASGYMTSKGVSNQETSYYDGYEYKAHTSFVSNALDCVVFVGDDIVLDAHTGVVQDGTAEIQKYIQPNQEREEDDD